MTVVSCVDILHEVLRKSISRLNKYKMAPEPEIGQTANEFTIESPPLDTISSVNFSPKSANFLLVSSWDDVSIP